MNSRQTRNANRTSIRIHRADESSETERMATNLYQQLAQIIDDVKKSRSDVVLEVEVDSKHPFLCSPSMLNLFASELAYILMTVAADSMITIFAGYQFGKNEIEIAFDSSDVNDDAAFPAFSRRVEQLVALKDGRTIQRHLIRCPEAGFVQVLREDATIRLAKTA